jgi:hydroxymethylpyrimidine pyrophosphatase-like HAD family hydrolase
MRIAFDVDGTLIHQSGSREDTPRYDIIALFHSFEKLGYEMYIWSGGGVDYATRWKEKLGLNAKVVEKGSFKPDIAVDDMAHESEFNLGVVNLAV